MKSFIFCVLIFCGSQVLVAGELATEHHKLYKNYKFEYDKEFSSVGSRPFTNSRSKTGITEIAIERSGCYGTCPVYTAKISSDGVLNYIGRDFVKRKGFFTAQVSTYNFDNIAEFINKINFKRLLPFYTSMVTDQETVFTKVSYSDGTSKIVSDYADCGPVTLWALEALIDDAISQASNWKKLKKQAQQDAAANP